jgi:hypothetical protein
MKNIKFFLAISLFLQFVVVANIFSQVTEKCGTFSPEVLAKVGMVCSRPSFYPSNLPVQTIHTNNFIIHFITDVIPPENFEPPDDKTTYQYAEKVALAAESAWNFQVNQLDWQAPPGDGDCGGGYNKYDIYIKFDWSFGYTQKETQVSGSNAFTSFIVITNQITFDNVNFRPLTDDEIKVTVTHEFNHALHFGYTGTKPTNTNSWFFENTATWMEEIHYPDINEWISFFLHNPNFYTPLNRPHLNIDFNGGNYPYSGALFCHLLSRWFNNNLIKNIWIYSAQSNNSFLNDINAVLVNNGQNLKTALKRYAIWRYFTGERDDGNHFPKGQLYPTSKVLRNHNNGTGSGNSSPDNLSSRGGTSYITYKNANGVINISFDGQNNTEFAAIALNKRIYFEDVENNFTLNSSNDGSVSNLSCIGEDYVVLIPVITEWQNLQSNISYSYSSVLGTGISTSFWTEKENTNITEGTLSVQLSPPITSSHSRNLTNLLPYREKTNFERFSNFQGKPVKHNNWNSLNNKYFLANDFESSIQNNRQSAKYLFLEPAKIQVRLEGNLIPGKGSASFLDPWYVLSNGSQPGNHWIYFISEYEPTGKEGATEKGVFLDQLISSETFYSVWAGNQLINLGSPLGIRQFYMQGWSATGADLQHFGLNQAHVVFTIGDAVVQANLKGQGLSNNQNAYTNNNQRKFLRTPDGNLHSAYESMNGIWYEVSTNNGVTWEIVGYGINLQGGWIYSEPSLTFFVDGLNKIHVFLFYRLQRNEPDDWLKFAEYVYENSNPIILPEENIELGESNGYQGFSPVCNFCK